MLEFLCAGGGESSAVAAGENQRGGILAAEFTQFLSRCCAAKGVREMEPWLVGEWGQD